MRAVFALSLSLGLIIAERSPEPVARAVGVRIQAPVILRVPSADSVRCRPDTVPTNRRREFRSLMTFSVGAGFPPDREMQLHVDSLGVIARLVDMQWRERANGTMSLSNTVVYFAGDSVRGTFVYEREDHPSAGANAATSGVTYRALDGAELARARVLRDWLEKRRCDAQRT